MTNGGLKFIHPQTLRHLKVNNHTELLLPSWYGEKYIRNLKYKPSRTAWRNYVAWYLCAAGLPTARVASLLTLSASRVREIVSHSRKKWLVGNSIDTMKSLAKLDNLEGQAKEAHLLLGRRTEMAAAEYLMTRGASGIMEISAALKIGREAYIGSIALANGAVCNCRLCTNFHDQCWNYWDE